MNSPVQPKFFEMAQKIHVGLPLDFGTLLVIVGGGEVDFTDLQQLAEAGTPVVAADGGADRCAGADVTPAAIIGDMDSLTHRAAWESKTRLIEISEQETTDFEKCLYTTQAQVTVAIGMTGRRLDHTLAALDCASRYAPHRHVVFVDSHDLAVVCTGDFQLDLNAGDRLSIHPLGRVRFAQSRGLKYSLNGLLLAPGIRTGASNSVETGPVSIMVAPGVQAAYLVMMDKRYLSDVIAMLSGKVSAV